MEREIAKIIVKNFKEQKGPEISMLEALNMTKIYTDNCDVYAIQKGDVTFLAWVALNKCIRTKVVCW